jgi:hypothetical protein
LQKQIYSFLPPATDNEVSEQPGRI